ncbi:hypothetical protein LCGC14_2150130, partial [marine sediment metagenome]
GILAMGGARDSLAGIEHARARVCEYGAAERHERSGNHLSRDGS